MSDALPLIVSTRDLVRWSGINSRRLGRHLQARGIPCRAGRASSGRTYNLEDLELLWPELLRAVRLRLARGAVDPEAQELEE